ncbi:unnamed protein product, partial [Iphiclides podalirius]
MKRTSTLKHYLTPPGEPEFIIVSLLSPRFKETAELSTTLCRHTRARRIASEAPKVRCTQRHLIMYPILEIPPPRPVSSRNSAPEAGTRRRRRVPEFNSGVGAPLE